MVSEQQKILPSFAPGFRELVIGASGGIGSALCHRLQDEPHIGEVLQLSHSGDQFDLLSEESVASAAQRYCGEPIQLLICATGILSINDHAPEKTFRNLDPEIMLQQFRVNAIGPALVIKHFMPLLDRHQRAVAAFLSARVGSIGDNRLGGWVSYRSAKAALNQIVRTASIEYARMHPSLVMAAVHPGTVETALSARFSSRHKTVTPDDAAASILSALDGLTPERTGSFIAYDGTSVPW